MSLFTAREWWGTKLGSDGDEFDQGSLCVANIDNDPSGKVKIVTGSLHGVLRVHAPSGREYRVEDCLLEEQLECGILQMEAGRFLGGLGICLAVLFPRKLAVYSLQSVGSSYLQLSKLYEHILEHTAANMTTGGFGGVADTEYICVQSYDGQLSFFESEALAFSRFLPGFLIPGPLCYCRGSDSFVTCSAAFELESYKYSVLAAASGEKHNDAGSTGPVGAAAAKRIQGDWRLVLGEAAVDIRLGRITLAGAESAAGTLIVLCEHNVYCVSLRGELLTQQRLEYHPACCWPYPCAAPAGLEAAPENLLIATHTKALLVYRGHTLAWAARLDTQPVAVRVADISGHQGMIVTLDDAGALSVCYLGSEPPVHAAPQHDTRELNYEAMDAEHRALQGKIKAADGHKGSAVEPADKLIMKAQVPSRLDTPGRAGGFDANDDDADASFMRPRAAGAAAGPRRLTVTLRLAHSGQGPLRDVGVAVLAPPPLVVPDGGSSFVVDEVPSSSGGGRGGTANGNSDGTAVRVVFEVPEGNQAAPASSSARFTAVYKTAAGEGRTAQLQVALPLCLFCQVVPPVKSAEFKITLDTNRDPPLLTQLFNDLMLQAEPGHLEALSRAQGANALCLRHHGPGGHEVTILVSKNAGRYRLQANSFHSMALVTSELAKRLAAYYAAAEAKPNAGSSKQPPFAVSFQEQLPLQDWFELVEEHFAARAAVADVSKQLEERAAQFRSVQKRLLTRFKDKVPAPLAQLDVLLEETYHQLVELGSSLEAAQASRAAAAQVLSAGTHLLLLLTRWRYALSDTDFELLRAHLSPEVTDGSDTGWEEATEASMTHLLRTALAKSAREAAAAVPPLTPARDMQRLRKHVALVLERLGKGMQLSGGGFQEKGDEAEQNGGS